MFKKKLGIIFPSQNLIIKLSYSFEIPIREFKNFYQTNLNFSDLIFYSLRISHFAVPLFSFLLSIHTYFYMLHKFSNLPASTDKSPNSSILFDTSFDYFLPIKLKHQTSLLKKTTLSVRPKLDIKIRTTRKKLIQSTILTN